MGISVGAGVGSVSTVGVGVLGSGVTVEAGLDLVAVGGGWVAVGV